MSDKYKLTKFDWKGSIAGWNEVRKSSGVQNALMEAANQIAANAGEGYKAVQMSTRVIVVPETKKAERDNLRNNTLLKSRR